MTLLTAAMHGIMLLIPGSAACDPWTTIESVVVTHKAPSRSEHVSALAKELLDGIESEQLPAESLIHKATRLANAVGNENAVLFWSWEITGIDRRHPKAVAYMKMTGRYRQSAGKLDYSYIQPLPAVQQAITETERQLKRQLDATQPGRPDDVMTGVLRRSLWDMRTIRLCVRRWLHNFAMRIYHEKLFSGMAETVFERYKGQVDTLLAEHCGDVLDKFPAIYDRLAEGDAEAVSQGLTTCRRVLESFADAVNPPSDRTITVDGKSVSLNKSNWRARVREYLDDRVTSTARKGRLTRTLRDLANRLGAAVHDDVAPDEGKALLLHTYLFVGEVITLAESSAPPEPQAMDDETGQEKGREETTDK